MKLFIFLLLLTLSFSTLSFPQGYQTKEIYEVKEATDIRKVADCAAITFTATIDESTTTDTSLVIPKNSTVTKSFLRIRDAKVISSDDNTWAFQCESAADLISAADLTDIATGSYVQGAVTDAATLSWISTDECTVQHVTGTGTSGITSADVDICVEYIIRE